MKKKLLYIGEVLGLLGILSTLTIGSSYDSDCWCEIYRLVFGKDKLVHEEQMLVKYRDRMENSEARIIYASADKKDNKDRGYISGTVLGNGEPLQSVSVTAWDTSYGSGYGVCTNADGYYIISHLPEGENLWKIETDPPESFVGRWYDDKPSFWTADTVRVIPGDTTKNIDFDLPLAGFISGTVTSEDKEPLEGVWVDVYDNEWNYVSGDNTDETGFYTVAGLEAGVPHKAQTWKWGSPYVMEWWNNKPDFVYADEITVTAGDTIPNIDFELTLGGCITGIVTGPDKKPIEGIIVDAFSIVNGGSICVDWWGTDSLGRYILSGLPLSSGLTGGYRLRCGRTSQYAHQWYSDEYNFKTADVVSIITAGQTVDGIDFTLAPGGVLTGWVTSDAGDSLPNIGIYIYDNTARNPLEPAVLAATFVWPDSVIGLYEVGLPPGEYRVRTVNREEYIDEYYNDQTSWNDANLVSIILNETTYADFILSTGGKVEGFVYDTDGVTPLPRVAVAAIRSNTGEAITFTQSSVVGSYSISGLPTGWYKVCAIPWADMAYSSLPDLVNIIHAFEFYDDKRTLSTADSVYILAPDSIVTGIDFVLGTGESGAIAGNVAISTKQPEDAQVTAYGDGGPFYGWIPVNIPASPDETGDYLIAGLGEGDYKVSAELEGYDTQWWENEPDSSSADLVTVTPPDTTKNINFYLIGIEEDNLNFVYRLTQNYPNPFCRKTVISYQLPVTSRISLKVYDISGRLVKCLVNGIREPGNYIAKWDGRGADGDKLASGIYFYRFDSGSFQDNKKLILIQ
ncbi:T9SS type A sorting domain-containing protein [candidate division WOR-3 bacterium]|nr:T9SS type A sorting domain-containing protein [candidate division WOR-3 bacterium]